MIADSLQRLLHAKIVIEGLDAQQATEEVMHEWEAAFGSVDNQVLIEQLFGLVRPLVSDKAKRIYRNHTRALEDRVFSDQPLMVRHVDPLTGAVSNSEGYINWHEAQKQLLTRMFNLPDGRWVSYEDSTPEDHEKRAMWQKSRADSITRDATRHEALAQLMREHDVERLGDLDANMWKGLIAN